MHILLYHPDLGLGGAERLIIDLTLSLHTFKHTTEIHTSQYTPAHAFPECQQLHIKTHAMGIGRHRPTAIVEYIKAIYCAIVIVVTTIYQKKKIDVIIADQISIGIPLLKLTGAKVNPLPLFLLKREKLKG